MRLLFCCMISMHSMVKYYILFNFGNLYYQEVLSLKYFMDCRQHACTSKWKCGENKTIKLRFREVKLQPCCLCLITIKEMDGFDL